MASGIRLQLHIGPAVPIPAPREVMEALESVKVTVSDQTSAFELRFRLPMDSPLHTLFLLSGGTPIPLLRVVIVVSVFGTDHVLMDGLMTRHEVSAGDASGMSSITLQGEDMAAAMNLLPLNGMPWPAMPPAARVELMLLKYLVLGVAPLVVPPIVMDVPIPTQRIPLQQGTDLGYIRQLAQEAGHVFFIDPGPVPGMSVAYWGPALKVGVPQPALSPTNAGPLGFSFDAEQAALPVILVQNEATRVPLPIPVPPSPLAPPLGAVPPIPKRIEPVPGTARMSPARAALLGMARASASAEAVSVSGTLDVLRYGRVLRARQLVGVREVGPAFDGLYYVKSATHEIKAGDYKQSFTLTRNGLLSTVPAVVP